MTGEDFTFAGVEQALTNGLTTLVATASVVGLILILILLIALGWNYFKLLLETVERYIVVGVLCYTSPLAFSMGASKSTNNVFKSWCRMVGSQLLLLVMNVWFLRGFASSMGQFIGNGGALTTGKGSIFLWMFCALAYLKCAQRFDSYLASMGLNVAQTGSSMGMELLMAARVISGVGSGARSAGSVFGRAGGNATATGTGAAASGFAAGFASRFSPNSYVRDAVVDGGTRMGFSGGAGFVGRAFGGIAARNGATLNGQSISSVASRSPGASGTIAGEIADRSLSNYMPHMQGFQMKGTQITGGHISTTATTPDGKKANVDMYSASQFEKPDAPHSVVTASDGSQWYQMASGEGRGAFYDAPVFGGMDANQARDSALHNDAPGTAGNVDGIENPTGQVTDTDMGSATNLVPGAEGIPQNMGAFPVEQVPGDISHENISEHPGAVPGTSEMPSVLTGTPTGMDGGIHLGNEQGNPGTVSGVPGDQMSGVVEGQENGMAAVQPGIVNDGNVSAMPEAPGEGVNEIPEFGAAFVGGTGIGPGVAGVINDTDDIPHPVEMVQGESTGPGAGMEGNQFAENFVPAEGGQNIISFTGGMSEMPAESGGADIPNDADTSAQFGAAFASGNENGQMIDSNVTGGTDLPAVSGLVQSESGASLPEGEAPQFGSAFVPENGVVHEGPAFVGDSDGFSHIPGAVQGTVISENGVEGHEVSESDSHVPHFGAGFVGGGNANEYGDSFGPDGAENGYNGGVYSHGGDQFGGYAEAPLVAATFPGAQEGTMLRTVGDGVIEASSPDGGNTLWYNSAYFQEPDAPHSVMEAANGVQWYAMQPQAHAPQFESGAEAAQYNQAAFQNFMPGYEGQVAHVDGTHRLDGHFEVRNADGSGTAFYDTARYAAPRGDYQVLEDARGAQWYAIRGEAAVDRKPVYENGQAVYDDGKLRTVSVETVRYKQIPARFAEPQKRGDIDRKPPRRKQ